MSTVLLMKEEHRTTRAAAVVMMVRDVATRAAYTMRGHSTTRTCPPTTTDPLTSDARDGDTDLHPASSRKLLAMVRSNFDEAHTLYPFGGGHGNISL